MTTNIDIMAIVNIILLCLNPWKIPKVYHLLCKVIDFGTNRKGVCDFLLVRRSNLGPILHRFQT